MNKLKFLGRGSGYNVKEGNTSAYIIKNNSLLLIDCGNDIFYSGDAYETKFNMIPFLEKGNVVYHDTCINDCEENPHTSLRVLCEKLPQNLRRNVYCIRIDGDNFIETVEKEGFIVPHVLV